ncbi:uncharacterized protein LOC111346651 [Stylophora pistillata]|uniref:uncharacterized protein LOC111346651 n=1 Tax=Stylophora pistillata TaxID=50429 RepID=UPI000C03EE50|nr:uncharacterized protein LOC111346651 [Stylophora pistillata]
MKHQSAEFHEIFLQLFCRKLYFEMLPEDEENRQTEQGNPFRYCSQGESDRRLVVFGNRSWYETSRSDILAPEGQQPVENSNQEFLMAFLALLILLASLVLLILLAFLALLILLDFLVLWILLAFLALLILTAFLALLILLVVLVWLFCL